MGHLAPGRYCNAYKHALSTFSLVADERARKVPSSDAYEHTSTSTSSICSEPSISRRTD